MDITTCTRITNNLCLLTHSFTLEGCSRPSLYSGCDEETKFLLDMRKNIVHYATVIDTYAPCITGSIKWNNDVNMDSYCATTDRTTWNRNILTMSDEAFMLLCLINYGKRWFNECIKIQRKVREWGSRCTLFYSFCISHCN